MLILSLRLWLNDWLIVLIDHIKKIHTLCVRRNTRVGFPIFEMWCNGLTFGQVLSWVTQPLPIRIQEKIRQSHEEIFFHSSATRLWRSTPLLQQYYLRSPHICISDEVFVVTVLLKVKCHTELTVSTYKQTSCFAVTLRLNCPNDLLLTTVIIFKSLICVHDILPPLQRCAHLLALKLGGFIGEFRMTLKNFRWKKLHEVEGNNTVCNFRLVTLTKQ